MKTASLTSKLGTVPSASLLEPPLSTYSLLPENNHEAWGEEFDNLSILKFPPFPDEDLWEAMKMLTLLPRQSRAWQDLPILSQSQELFLAFTMYFTKLSCLTLNLALTTIFKSLECEKALNSQSLYTILRGIKELYLFESRLKMTIHFYLNLENEMNNHMVMMFI